MISSVLCNSANYVFQLETLIEIWTDLNSEMIPARYRPHTHLGLPEPPKQREMLVTEIHLLIEVGSVLRGMCYRSRYGRVVV